MIISLLVIIEILAIVLSIFYSAWWGEIKMGFILGHLITWGGVGLISLLSLIMYLNL